MRKIDVLNLTEEQERKFKEGGKFEDDFLTREQWGALVGWMGCHTETDGNFIDWMFQEI